MYIDRGEFKGVDDAPKKNQKEFVCEVGGKCGVRERK